MNLRYLHIIDANRALLADATILDLGSHDGRWAFAALEAGARSVHGVEARQELVDHTFENFAHYGIDPARYDFVCADALTHLTARPAKSHDVVLCLGFLYHTPFHMNFIIQMARLARKAIIIDSGVVNSDRPIVEFRHEDILDPRRANDYLAEFGLTAHGGVAKFVTGLPSVPALRLMLETVGFNARLIPWEVPAGQEEEVNDYVTKTRITLVAEPVQGGE